MKTLLGDGCCLAQGDAGPSPAQTPAALTNEMLAELRQLGEAALSSIRYADDTRIRRCAHTHSNAAMSFVNGMIDLLKQAGRCTVTDLKIGKPPTIPGKAPDRRAMLKELNLPVPKTGNRWRNVATVLAEAAWFCVCDPATCPAREYCQIAKYVANGDVLLGRSDALLECGNALLRWAQGKVPLRSGDTDAVSKSQILCPLCVRGRLKVEKEPMGGECLHCSECGKNFPLPSKTDS